MFLGIVLRPALPKLGDRLDRVRLADLVTPDGQSHREGCIGDLGPDDQIALQGCSRAFWARRSGVRCQVAYWQREPPCIQGRFYRGLRWLPQRFDSVLTYDQNLLSDVPRSRFVAHGGCWIDDPSAAGNKRKREAVSLIASPKRSSEGHRLRHQIIDWARRRQLPLSAYGKQYQPLSDKRSALEPYRFSVVIENMRTSNYFTEKLIDCFVCGCIPIYWGTPEIARFFDPDGMVVCSSEGEIRSAIETATPEHFESRRSALAANRQRALRFVDYHQHVFDALRGYAILPAEHQVPKSIESSFRRQRAAVAS